MVDGHLRQHDGLIGGSLEGTLEIRRGREGSVSA